MPLSADQTAMLELLLDGGQDYEELADLFGLDQSEVRDRARAALAEIGGSDPDRNAPLSDYLLGKADPIDRADAVRRLKEDPDDHALAAAHPGRPGRDLSRDRVGQAAARPRRRPLHAQAARRRLGASRLARAAPATSPSSLDDRQKRLIAILGGGAIILIVIILAITGVFGGGDSSDSTDSSTSASALDLANGHRRQRQRLRDDPAQGSPAATLPVPGA